MKYASDGGDTIHIAFTNAHPAGAADVNIHYAAYRAGRLLRADGTAIGTLDAPIAPTAADVVFDDPVRKAWVHDVAQDAAGRPVIVFAAFPSPGDHRYLYARWTGAAWQVHEMTAAGGSISDDGREPYYSGGLTLDHEDPAVVYLSRPVAGMWEIETWRTADGGATWTRQAVTTGSDAKNVRPVSPRGLVPFSSDLSVVWMRGIYTSYIDYRTSITTLLRTAGNAPPIADAIAAPRRGPAPLEVAFDGRAAADPDGSIVAWEWDFGDGARASGPEARHTYEAPGRWFPSLTVTDDAGARDVFVGEVVVEPRAAPVVFTGPATDVDSGAATVTGTVDPSNQRTTYRFEFGPTTAYGATTPEQTLPDADDREHAVTARLTGLTPGATVHYRLVAENATGRTVGEDRTFTAQPPGPSAYREAVLATEGLRAYWRLGERTGTVAVDETGTHPGAYAGGVRLGAVGALAGDPDTAAAFDGESGEMTASGPALASAGSLEGWFDWRQGVAVLRDTTSTGAAGWILAYESSGRLAYRVAGTAYDTGVPIQSVRDGWHHLVLTKDGPATAFYLDGRLVHSGTGAGSATSVLPWHVMRNGNQPTQYAQGRADEVAVYDRALPEAVVRRHFELGRGS